MWHVIRRALPARHRGVTLAGLCVVGALVLLATLAALVPGSRLIPRLTTGATDARFFRRVGSVAYGFGLFSRALTAEAMAGRFHGNDERIDVESLALTTQAWLEVCEQFLGT